MIKSLKQSICFYVLLFGNICLSLDKLPLLLIEPCQMGLQEFKVVNLVPGQMIRLEATCRDQDGQGNVWRAYAEFQADVNGVVDIATQAPFGGSYSTVDINGLFWSMLSLTGCTERFVIGVQRILPITIDLFINQNLIAQRVICINKRDQIITYKINEAGLVGELHIPSNPTKIKHTTVLFVGGSEGGIPKGMGQFFAQQGYVTLALAYFGVNSLPKHLENIPLEYFERAIDWLKAYCQIDRCVMMGISRGGELALLIGSLFPDKLAGVIADVPCHVVQPGFPNVTRPAWTYRDKAILDSLVGLPLDENFVSNLSMSSFEHPYNGTIDFLKDLEKNALQYEKATIPVEQIRASLLLIGGLDDAMWPSGLYVQKIVDRLKEFNSATYCKAMIFPNAGHAPRPPYLPQIDFPSYHPVGKHWFNCGGTMLGNANAASKLYPELINFLELI